MVEVMVENAPGLEELYFDRCPIQYSGPMTFEKKPAESVYEALKGGIPIQGAPGLRQFDKIIAILAMMTSLEYVEVLDRFSRTKRIMLQKDEDGNRVGCIDAPDQNTICRASRGAIL
ncbi:hypothetical protein M422DRAFT_71731 [Sphaerobolus stellatus SS14]|uniref:Uncharacterized protein n=1 Tax=Sphaerobolus stellatus (strain SS14) TaxID=990650 RepID=A0A0C9UN92_SPHS4|nr:hypothetical protein M422DRAFT_71812 [Sphaerobolus stellatus SS14]KIJ27191.1 hypothetical protein M422DRAFT_71731 [Sphaerobolus stellatus SS14]